MNYQHNFFTFALQTLGLENYAENPRFADGKDYCRTEPFQMTVRREKKCALKWQTK